MDFCKEDFEDEVIDDFRGNYRWLSNFHLVTIAYGGIVYTSTEAAYQASKTLNLNERVKISQMSPKEAKQYGSSKLIVLRPEWEVVKLGIMEDVLRLKFKNLKLKQKLLDTYPKELIEGNTWGDTYWGVCKGVGQNYLGRLLMAIRDELYSELIINKKEAKMEKPGSGNFNEGIKAAITLINAKADGAYELYKALAETGSSSEARIYYERYETLTKLNTSLSAMLKVDNG